MVSASLSPNHTAHVLRRRNSRRPDGEPRLAVCRTSIVPWHCVGGVRRGEVSICWRWWRVETRRATATGPAATG